MTGSQMMNRSGRNLCQSLLPVLTMLFVLHGAQIPAADDVAPQPSSRPAPTPSLVTNRIIFASSSQTPTGTYSDPTLSTRSTRPRVRPKLENLQKHKQATLEELHNKAARLVKALNEKKALQERAAAARAAADRQRALMAKAALERAEAERVAAEKAAAERAEAERLAAEKAAAEKLAAQKAEAERLAAQKLAEQRRIEDERAIAERQRLEEERRLAEQAAAERAAAEKAAAERAIAERERAMQEKAATEKALAELERIEAETRRPLMPVESFEPKPLEPTPESVAQLPTANAPLSIPSLPPANALPIVEQPASSKPMMPELPVQTVEVPSVEQPASESVAAGSPTPQPNSKTEPPSFSDTPIEGPIDRMALATSLFATEQHAGCLRALEGVDQESLKGEKRDWYRYMTACCLRKQGQLSEAESQYRKLLGQSETEWLSEAARWWLDHLNEQHKLQQDLAQVNSTLDTWQKEIHALQSAN